MKKIYKFSIACILFYSLFSLTAFSSVPPGSVIIGTTIYNLDYANKNPDIISQAISKLNWKIYVKTYDGNWIDNDTGQSMHDIPIDTAEYKGYKYIDSNGKENDSSLYGHGSNVHLCGELP